MFWVQLPKKFLTKNFHTITKFAFGASLVQEAYQETQTFMASTSTVILIETIFNNTNKTKQHLSLIVTTLTLGSQPRQKLARLRAKREVRESHLMLSGVQKNAKEWTLTLPSELPFWEGYCNGQSPLDWRVIYIIGKLLKHKCLKWARMTHLDIWNTSYGQKEGWKSNW